MRSLVSVACLSVALASLGCSGSDSTEPKDPSGSDGGDAAKGDTAGAPDALAPDAPIPLADMADGTRDLAKNDVPGVSDAGPARAPDLADARGNETPDASIEVNGVPEAGGSETSAILDALRMDAVADVSLGEVPADLPVTGDGGFSETSESCSCDNAMPAYAPAKLPWSCFCTVESCSKTLAYFVDHADGGQTLVTGRQIVSLTEYADCNLVLVLAKTYSNYVPASEYVFDLGTGALVGAKVWLDDRQHSCPFTGGVAQWVFGYQSGDYPVPTTCHASTCLAGSGRCTDADAL